MLFNSIDFAVFLPVVFTIHWLLQHRSLRAQNIFLLGASYLFYGWWDWRFLLLILASTGIDYFVGLRLDETTRPAVRRRLLLLSLCGNIGMLGTFKYLGFFVENFRQMFSFFGQEIPAANLNIVLPVGISFYTFQTLSYTIDVYRGKVKPTRDFVDFAAYVAFFPQLVAGPIERASNLLPQFHTRRRFDADLAAAGMRQILWGLFKKIVVADRCGVLVDDIFATGADASGSTLLIASALFAFQIYCDFSGYSDVAIGVAKLLGFRLMTNFAYPYFSRDIAEFWRRWHISLSSWFRDYLYIPLGGSRKGTARAVRNIFVIFAVSGFWHGANWTFIIWGLLNALYFLPLLLTGSNRRHLEITGKGRLIPPWEDLVLILVNFFLVTIAWFFFRAENLSHAMAMLGKVLSPDLYTMPTVMPVKMLAIIGFLLGIEWLGRTEPCPLDKIASTTPTWMHWPLYYALMWAIIVSFGTPAQFIYFQF
ncbi:MAG: MBOAT family O-acyltransferase [Oceanipulchritudo sp.]